MGAREENAGLFRLQLAASEDGAVALVGAPEEMAAAGRYHSPLVVSPDGSQIAYLRFDVRQPSHGRATPARQPGRGTAIDRQQRRPQPDGLPHADPLRVSRSGFSAWLTDDTLLVTRSRFAEGAGGVADRFGVTAVTVGAGEAIAG